MLKPLKILQASAGSGKTFSLTLHYLNLIIGRDRKYRDILAVTFTNKATMEMKERILSVLYGLAKDDDTPGIASYRQLLLEQKPNYNRASLQAEAHRIYRDILHDYKRFSINTIDGFVQRVIRSFAFELGLSGDYTVELNESKVTQELLQKLEQSLEQHELIFDWLVEGVLEKIDSGKRWDYKEQLQELIKQIFKDNYQDFDEAMRRIGPENIHRVFEETKQKMNKIINDFEHNIAEQSEKVEAWIEQFDLTKECFKGKSRSPIFKINRLHEDRGKLIYQLIEWLDNPSSLFQNNAKEVEHFPALKPILEALQTIYFDGIADYCLSLELKKDFYFLRLMYETSQLLSEYRSENENLLISDAQKLINGITNPIDEQGNEIGDENPSFIWEKVGTTYRNYLIDEFQDTSVQQWKSFRVLLSNAIASASGRYIDHLIVGDTKQSIYRWRNGDWAILHRQAEADIGSAYVVHDSLKENYRSSAHIIDFNNSLYQKLATKAQANINAKFEGDSAWWSQEGYDQVLEQLYKGVAQTKPEQCPAGGVVKVYRLDPSKEQKEEDQEVADFKTLALEKMLDEIRYLRDELGYQLRDIAVLVRKNQEAALCVESLMKEGIAVVSAEALKLANHPSIKLIINTLRSMQNLESETTLYKANCIVLYQQLRGKTCSAAMLAMAKQELNKLACLLPTSLCENWQRWLQLPLSELVEQVIAAYELHLQNRLYPFLLAFRDLVGEQSRSGEKGLSTFLKWWDEEGQEKALPSSDQTDALQIYTIHKSKGLAFRAVLVPFCNWATESKHNTRIWAPAAESPFAEFSVLPLPYVKNLKYSSVSKSYYREMLDSMLDAMNMLYVATTRAKDYLFLAFPSNDYQIGKLLNECMEELAETEGLSFSTEGYYEKVNPIANAPQAKLQQDQALHLNHYPHSQRMAALYRQDNKEQLPYVLQQADAARLGSLKHQVLANANHAEAVENELEQLWLAGTISKTEQKQLKLEVMQVLEQADLKALLADAEERFTEKTIVDSAGNSHRPDLAIWKANTLHIVDYKFTLGQEKKHIEQVQGYAQLYRELGYSSVKGYLYYAHNHSLVRVENT